MPLRSSDALAPRTFATLVASILLASMVAGWAPTFDGAAYAAARTDPFPAVNRLLSGWPAFWRNVTEFGDAAVLLPLLALVVRDAGYWAAICAAVPATVLCSALGKHLLDVPRPAAVLAPDRFTLLGDALAGHNGLPSGHARCAFAILTVTIGVATSAGGAAGVRRMQVVAGTLLAALVGASRIAVGAHWPMDVIAGAVLGVLAGASGPMLVRGTGTWWRCAEAPRARRAFAALMLVWAGVLIAGCLEPARAALVVPWAAAAALVTALRLSPVQRPRIAPTPARTPLADARPSAARDASLQ